MSASARSVMTVHNVLIHDVHPGSQRKTSNFFEALVPMVLRYEALWESAQPKTNPMNKEEAG